MFIHWYKISLLNSPFDIGHFTILPHILGIPKVLVARVPLLKRQASASAGKATLGGRWIKRRKWRNRVTQKRKRKDRFPLHWVIIWYCFVWICIDLILFRGDLICHWFVSFRERYSPQKKTKKTWKYIAIRCLIFTPKCKAIVDFQNYH